MGIYNFIGTTFLLIIINFIENPFNPTTANFVITNGNGLNPLLQNNYGHTSTYFIFRLCWFYSTIRVWYRCFSFKKNRFELDNKIRRWSLPGFQSIGIILGGWWAYQELGWGGYWAWDPVE